MPKYEKALHMITLALLINQTFEFLSLQQKPTQKIAELDIFSKKLQ